MESPIHSDSISPSKGDSIADQQMGKSKVLTAPGVLLQLCAQQQIHSCLCPLQVLFFPENNSCCNRAQKTEITVLCLPKLMFKVRNNRKVRSQKLMQMHSMEFREFNATGHQQTEILQIVPLLTYIHAKAHQNSCHTV